MLFEPEIACQLALGAILLGVLLVGGPARIRAEQTGGGVPLSVDPAWFWIGMGVVGIPVAFFCLAFLVEPEWVARTRLPLPPAVRLLGAPIGGAGVGLFAWMFRHLGLNVTSTSMPRANATLVTSGPYRWIRHPMYSATLLLVLAAGLLTANAIMVVGGADMFGLLVARSGLEEARLLERFGDRYRIYQSTTGRFFPRIGGSARPGRHIR